MIFPAALVHLAEPTTFPILAGVPICYIARTHAVRLGSNLTVVILIALSRDAWTAL
jgi:hypothetical protein